MSKRRRTHTETDARKELFKISHPMIWMFGIVALTFQLLPLYLKEIGIVDSRISLLMMVPPFIAIMANQFWGYLADIHFDSKTVMIIMSLGSIGVMIAFPFFPNFLAIVILMAFMTFFSNARIPMLNALILDSKKTRERYGLIRSIGSFAFIVIGGFAALLSDIADGPGISVIFPICVILNGLLIISLKPLPSKPAHLKKKKTLGFFKVQKVLFKKPVIRIFLIFIVVNQMAMVPSLIAQSLYIKDENYVGGSNFDVSMALNVGAILEIIFFLSYDWISKHVRLMPLFFIATVAGPIRWIIVGSTTSITVIWMSNILHMATYGMMYMCAVMFINKELPPKLRNSGQTLLALVFTGLSIVSGQFLAFVFLEFFPLRYWFFFAAALALVPFPLWWKMSQLYCAEHKVSGIFIRK